MITLREACEIAKDRLNGDDTFVENVCDDLGDCWVFDWSLKSDPHGSILDKPLLKIDKETGEASFVVMGVPGEEFFHRMYRNKNKIDISKYL